VADVPLGHLFGLRLSAMPSSAVAYVLLIAGLSWLGAARLGFSWAAAVVTAVLAAGLHLASDLVHNLGHAQAARRTGYPMTGVRLWGLLATSVYPADEPALPAEIHIRRALGGAPASLLLSLPAIALAVWLRRGRGPLFWLAAFVALDNVSVFGFGALLPLGFTDGSTLLHWWGQRRASGD
jgi:hypothetical protein